MAGRFGAVSCVLLLVNCVQILMSTPSILKAPLKGETAMYIFHCCFSLFMKNEVGCETCFPPLRQPNMNKSIQIPLDDHIENIRC